MWSSFLSCTLASVLLLREVTGLMDRERQVKVYRPKAEKLEGAGAQHLFLEPDINPLSVLGLPTSSWLLPAEVCISILLKGSGGLLQHLGRYHSTCVVFYTIGNWYTDCIRTRLSKNLANAPQGLWTSPGHPLYCKGSWPQIIQWKKKKPWKDFFEKMMIFILNLLLGWVRDNL